MVPALQSQPWFKYFAGQDEVAPDTGRRHLQCVVYTSEKKTANTVCRILGFVNPYIAAVRGTPEQARDYCIDGPTSQAAQLKKGKPANKRMPEGNYLEWGTLPEVSQGTRTDIAKFIAGACKPGASYIELVRDPETQAPALRHVRAFEKIQREILGDAKPRPNVRVTFCFGAPNCGKSLCTGSKVLHGSELSGDPYMAEIEGMFWLAYRGQTKVIFDDFTGGSITPANFQRVTDSGPLTCNVKNSDYPFKGTDIRISSNFMPDRWWKPEVRVDIRAVTTRIHEAHHHWKDPDGTYWVAEYKYPNGQGRETIGPNDLCPVERMALDLDVFRPPLTHTRATLVHKVIYAPAPPADDGNPGSSGVQSAPATMVSTPVIDLSQSDSDEEILYSGSMDKRKYDTDALTSGPPKKKMFYD